jgi:hypothetical protein
MFMIRVLIVLWIAWLIVCWADRLLAKLAEMFAWMSP